MAIWHFRLILVPEVSLRRRWTTVPERILTELADSPWWSSVEPQLGLEGLFDSILPPLEPWSEVRRWGYEHGHQAYVIYADRNPAEIEEIGLTIDARSASEELIEAYCRIASQLGCVFLTMQMASQQQLFFPEKENLLRALKASNASRFLVDPVATLKGLDCPTISVPINRKTGEN